MDHDFSPSDQRCVHCGTKREHHEAAAQPCPRRSAVAAEAARPEPFLRTPAADDIDAIYTRIQELRAGSIVKEPEEAAC